MKYIQQTNRTILFEQLNQEYVNLNEVIGDVDEKSSLSDEEIQTIHERFAIGSFQEFFQKFTPHVYMSMDTVQNQVQFGFVRPKGIQTNEVRRIELNETHPLVRALLQLQELKENPHQFQRSCLEMFSKLWDEDEINDFYRLRKELIQVYQYNMEHGGDDTKLEEVLSNLQKSYDKGIFLLKIFLEEARPYIFEEENAVKMEPIELYLSEESQIESVCCAIAYQYEPIHLQQNEERAYQQKIKELIRGIPFRHEELMYSLLCNNTNFLQKEKKQFVTFYNEKLQLYTKAVKSFMLCVQPLLNTMLGISTFFRQNQNIHQKMKPILIITNCSTDEFVDIKNKKRLQVYLESVNLKNNHRDTIWYAILPRIALLNYEELKVSRQRFLGSREEQGEQEQRMESMDGVVELLAKYRIQIFFSNSIGKKSTFRYVQMFGLQEWDTVLGRFKNRKENRYLISCYPNFTVVPKEHARINIGWSAKIKEKEKTLEIEREEAVVWYEGFGVEASYVAAGLVSACQCPHYLRQFFPSNVEEELPGVAYRLLKENQNEITTTIMSKEILHYPDELNDDIRVYGEGVIFRPAKYSNYVVAGSNRTLACLDGEKDSIATVQTMTYIDRVLRIVTKDYTNNKIKQFFKGYSGETLDQWSNHRKSVNAILKVGESIQYELSEQESTCSIEVQFEEVEVEETIEIGK